MPTQNARAARIVPAEMQKRKVAVGSANLGGRVLWFGISEVMILICDALCHAAAQLVCKLVCNSMGA